MKPSLTQIQGIQTLEVQNPEASTGVVFLHGYGASMHDLFPLWELWHQKDFHWYFPNGVLSLPFMYGEGRAWFSIDMMELERAMREGRHRDMKDSLPKEFHSTLKALESFLRELSQRHDHLILGGFSQGAMCASHLGLRDNLKVKALVLLSGALVAQSEFPSTGRALPFYQSHGTEDPLLSLEGAKDLEQKLQSLGAVGELHPFSGGHEIPEKVIGEVGSFLLGLGETFRG